VFWRTLKAYNPEHQSNMPINRDLPQFTLRVKLEVLLTPFAVAVRVRL